MTNSILKGKQGEREFAVALRSNGFDARRGQQFHGGPDSPDVVSIALAQFHFEVKRKERFNAYDSMEQAIAECGGRIPVVAHRRNRGDWLIVLRLQDFVKIVEVKEAK